MDRQCQWKPLFIFSLPRSGSTLVQRILAASGQIATGAEPWILLPFLYTMKSNGIASEYWHSRTREAAADFYGGFPNGARDYTDELRHFILSLYEKYTTSESRYFLDKTPRYHLICREITELFPEARFIMLWRNPLAVVSSILHSWCDGKWKINTYNIDIYNGLENLLTAYAENRSRFYTMQYERLVMNPSSESRRLFEYLELGYSDQVLQHFQSIRFQGRMGDKLGAKKYNNVNDSSLNQWRYAFANPFRRYWAENYLKWIGTERVELMGYDYGNLLSIIQNQANPASGQMICDLMRAIFTNGRNTISPLWVHHKKKPKLLYI